jgi:hypothetical protein
MDKMDKEKNVKGTDAQRNAPALQNEDSLDGGYTAIPKDTSSADDISADPDLVVSADNWGEMNEADARESGYIGEDGKAVDKAKKPDLH